MALGLGHTVRQPNFQEVLVHVHAIKSTAGARYS